LLKSLFGDIITENMVKLSKEDVLHVAKLAKLDISDQEIDKFTPQLSNVINYFGELSEVETEKVEPTSQTTGLENVFRADNIGSSLSPGESISGSDKIHNGYFKVEAVLTERTDK
jgi:aspartyl-tRNA(Asn)/glutamyl-tRNA(Gln) amidotransferase subunit C